MLKQRAQLVAQLGGRDRREQPRAAPGRARGGDRQRALGVSIALIVVARGHPAAGFAARRGPPAVGQDRVGACGGDELCVTVEGLGGLPVAAAQVELGEQLATALVG